MNNFSDVEVNLEGEEYVVTPIPAIKGLSFMRRLTKLLGPSMTALFSQSKDAEEAGEVGMDSMQKAVDLLVENMDSPEIEQLILDLMKTVTKNGQPLNFNMEFTASYGKLFKLLTEVVKVNFGSLFQLSGISI